MPTTAFGKATGIRLVRNSEPQEAIANQSTLLSFSIADAAALAASQTTLLLYRVNAKGEFLGSDGISVVATLQEAVIAGIGAVLDDFGKPLFSSGSTQVALTTGQELRLARSTRHQSIELLDDLLIESKDQSLRIRSSSTGSQLDLVIDASFANTLEPNNDLSLARKAGLADLLFLRDGELLDITLASSCANTNTYALIQVHLRQTAGSPPVFFIVGSDGKEIELANNEIFRDAVRANLAPGFRVSQGGHQSSNHQMLVRGTGFYAPVMLAQTGDVFFIGTYNRDGLQHIKALGDGAFAFEDLSGTGSDMDFNDGVLQIQRKYASASSIPHSTVFASGVTDALYLDRYTDLVADQGDQLIHSSGRGGNSILTGRGNDTVILYSEADRLALGSGDDDVHLIPGASGNTVDLGNDIDSDTIYVYRPGSTQSINTVRTFDSSRDRIQLVDLLPTDQLDIQVNPDSATLLINQQAILRLIGAFSPDALFAAIRRTNQDQDASIDAIPDRGLLIAALPTGIPGIAERTSQGSWSGANVDLARSIATQLTGNPDRIAFRPVNNLSEGLSLLNTAGAQLGFLNGSNTDKDRNSLDPQVQNFIATPTSPATTTPIGNRVSILAGLKQKVAARVGSAVKLWQRLTT